MDVLFGPCDAARFAAMAKDDRRAALATLRFCDGVLARRRDHVDALRLCADLLTALGYYEAGLALDQRLARIRPHDAGVWYNLACSLALTEAAPYMQARLALAQAVNLGYDNPEHMAGDRDLANLRDVSGFAELVLAAADNRRREA